MHCALYSIVDTRKTPQAKVQSRAQLRTHVCGLAVRLHAYQRDYASLQWREDRRGAARPTARPAARHEVRVGRGLQARNQFIFLNNLFYIYSFLANCTSSYSFGLKPVLLSAGPPPDLAAVAVGRSVAATEVGRLEMATTTMVPATTTTALV